MRTRSSAWITSASNKALYFVERASDKVGKITITETLLPGDAHSRPTSNFASGKSLFVTESGTDIVDQLSL